MKTHALNSSGDGNSDLFIEFRLDGESALLVALGAEAQQNRAQRRVHTLSLGVDQLRQWMPAYTAHARMRTAAAATSEPSTYRQKGQRFL